MPPKGKKKGKDSAFSYADEGDVDSLKELIEGDKAVLLKKDDNGWTLLHTAAFAGETEVIDLLLRYKMDVSATCNDGDTPLHYAAAQGQIDAIRALVKAGASFTAMDNDGETPLDVCAEKKAKRVLEELAKEREELGEDDGEDECVEEEEVVQTKGGGGGGGGGGLPEKKK